MAKVIGTISPKIVQARVKHSKRVKYNRPLTLPLGSILAKALESGKARSHS